MILFGSFTSPYVRHCRIALEQSGLPWELREVDYVASAELSPTKRVPLLKSDDLTLTDSSVILRYIRERSGKPFLPQLENFELFCLCNTALDTAANIFFLERDGVESRGGDYLERQANRLASALNELEAIAASIPNDQIQPILDSHLRLFCFLDWGVFRKRFGLTSRPNLLRLMQEVRKKEWFHSSKPPQN